MEPNLAALDRWQQAIQPLKEGKRPRASLQLIRQYVAALEEALAESVPIDRILPELDALPSGAVGRAYAAAYARLTPESDKAVFGWIGNCKPERADCERAYALPGLIDAAPALAFRVLCSMRRPPSKEQRGRLAGVLGDATASAIERMLAGEEKEYEVRRAVELLLSVAQEGKADRKERAAIVEAVIPSIERFRLHKGTTGSEVRNGMEAILSMPDAPLAGRLRALLDGGLEAAPEVPVRAPEEPGGEHHRKAVQTPPPENERAPAVVPEADPLAWFEAHIQMLERMRDSYRAARREAEEARAEAAAERGLREQAEARTAGQGAAEDRVQTLEDQLVGAIRERDAGRAELEEAARKVTTERELRQSKERELQETIEGFSREREKLERRIDTNAQARVHDFCIALSMAIKPLLHDIPRSAEADSAMAKFLSGRIDQILRTLAEKGLELRSSAGGDG